MKVCILFHRLGPYHHARLNTLATHCELSVIELSTIDNTYAWDVVENKHDYPVVPLFTDADINTKPVDDITRKTRNALIDIKPEVVAIPGWSSPAALVALQWCCETNTPAILMSDSTERAEPRAYWRERIKSRVVRLFSAALVAGEPHVNYVEQLGLPGRRIFIGYDVVDNAHFQTLSGSAQNNARTLRVEHSLPDHYFLTSNRFIEKKNLPRLLDAYAAYVRQTGGNAWGLVLLGDGPLKPILVEQVAHLGLESQVQFTGFKQYDVLPVYYGLAHAFIQASLSETWGLVVNEAMASGLPVLISEHCGCASDLVESGRNGFTFNPYDVVALTNLMLKIASDECDREAMGRASREIISHWTPNTFAKGLMNAAQVAMDAPRPKMTPFNRWLLKRLIRR